MNLDKGAKSSSGDILKLLQLVQQKYSLNSTVILMDGCLMDNHASPPIFIYVPQKIVKFPGCP